jgi:hypothetical protein
MTTYKVGSLVMSQQAFIILVAGSIGSLLLLFSSKERIAAVSALVLFAMISYQAYLTNCVLVGNCNVLSWFLVVMNLIFLFTVTTNRKLTA